MTPLPHFNIQLIGIYRDQCTYRYQRQIDPLYLSIDALHTTTP